MISGINANSARISTTYSTGRKFDDSTSAITTAYAINRPFRIAIGSAR